MAPLQPGFVKGGKYEVQHQSLYLAMDLLPGGRPGADGKSRA
jgi:hypothetical protein